MTKLAGFFLGLQPYAEVLQLQQRCAALRKLQRLGDLVLFVEHPPTLTQGRGSKEEHLLASRERLQALGVTLHTINRGGDITLHAPGQLVGYPIVELKRHDVRRYVQTLTQVMREVAAASNIETGTVDGYIGLWVDRERPQQWRGESEASSIAKLGAIGVAISRWVTSHGFALNLAVDLSLFDLIVPCGIAEHPVTSILELTRRAPTAQAAAHIAHAALAQHLETEASPLVELEAVELRRLLAADDTRFCTTLVALSDSSGRLLQRAASYP